eukprot:scaffold10890_cov62-Cyclotella_meneghiniana.AAC.2
MVMPLALGASESPLGQTGWGINKLCIGSAEGSATLRASGQSIGSPPCKGVPAPTYRPCRVRVEDASLYGSDPIPHTDFVHTKAVVLFADRTYKHE